MKFLLSFLVQDNLCKINKYSPSTNCFISALSSSLKREFYFAHKKLLVRLGHLSMCTYGDSPGVYLWGFPWGLLMGIPLGFTYGDSPGVYLWGFPWGLLMGIPLGCTYGDSPGVYLWGFPWVYLWGFPWGLSAALFRMMEKDSIAILGCLSISLIRGISTNKGWETQVQGVRLLPQFWFFPRLPPPFYMK